MGHLYYAGSADPIDIPDRLLAHIKVVIATKLRRNESFTLNWRDSAGRSTIWIQPSIEMRFVFSSPEAELLDSELLQELANGASASGGITLDLSTPSTDTPVLAV